MVCVTKFKKSDVFTLSNGESYEVEETIAGGDGNYLVKASQKGKSFQEIFQWDGKCVSSKDLRIISHAVNHKPSKMDGLVSNLQAMQYRRTKLGEWRI